MTRPEETKRLISLRLRKRLGPVQLAAQCQVAPSTAHRVLVRCRLNRLSHCDRTTGEPVRRYEHARPGDLVHVHVEKFGQIRGRRLAVRRAGAGREEPGRHRRKAP